MDRETPQVEVLRLLRELHKILQDEIFGGLSLAERADYDRKANRISELELLLETISLSFFSEPNSNNSGAWDKISETGTPHSLARLPTATGKKIRAFAGRKRECEELQPQTSDQERRVTIVSPCL
jgi:hypothetical protein